MAVEDAYRLMEDEDVERLPVTEDGRLVGVLSRSALTRRLAEDEPRGIRPRDGAGLSVRQRPGGGRPRYADRLEARRDLQELRERQM